MVTTQSIPSVTQLSSGISVLWNGSEEKSVQGLARGRAVQPVGTAAVVATPAGVPRASAVLRRSIGPPPLRYPTDSFDRPLLHPRDLKPVATYVLK